MHCFIAALHVLLFGSSAPFILSGSCYHFPRSVLGRQEQTNSLADCWLCLSLFFLLPSVIQLGSTILQVMTKPSPVRSLSDIWGWTLASHIELCSLLFWKCLFNQSFVLPLRLRLDFGSRTSTERPDTWGFSTRYASKTKKHFVLWMWRGHLKGEENASCVARCKRHRWTLTCLHLSPTCLPAEWTSDT